MLETVKRKLEALGCDAWELTETVKRGWEFYFIRHRLDQNRATAVRTVQVKVYRALEDGKFLGSASGEIPPTAAEAEMDKALAELLYQAGLVKNPAYTLTDKPVTLPARTGAVDVEAISETFIRTLRSIPETETEDVNSYEIFVSELRRHTLNSNGVEYVCAYPSSQAEVVVNARREGQEIELHRVFDSGACDARKLRADVEKALGYGRDRLLAVPTPRLGAGPVVFSTRDAVAIYRYFSDRMNAAMKVRRISDWEPGKPVCPVNGGDPITVEALPSLENASHDFPVDEEGSVIRHRFLIRGGVAENFWGSRQFSQYLGLEDSSLVYNFRFGGSSRTAADVRRGDYLEVVEFSDFQVNPMAGDIAGEIRLGYWHHGGEVTVVTGGSISGSMAEAAGSMTFSRETEQYDGMVIPAVTRLESLRITGAE